MSLHIMQNAKEVSQNNEKLETNLDTKYRTPQVIAIGKAIDLLQGASGKHTDSYSGYYWNGEGS